MARAIRLRGARISTSEPAQAASAPLSAVQISPLPSALAPIAAGCHQGERDRQVEMRALFREVGRRQ
uniref:Uncharacterized protein n=1 Tax=Rhizobium leguminosarum TaxID=384 RepID=A0A154IKY8_RHILE|nr:hypothetical protein A4A59_13580 [Rhizobium leguminosarum]